MSLAPRLTIDLDAITANWRALDALSAPACETAPVVKADGFGCGAVEAGRALARAGARTFFVAMPDEGVILREALGPAPVIYILAGYARADAALYRAHDLRAVLNSADQARWWFRDLVGRCAIHLDSGMNRLGMEAGEFAAIGGLPRTVDLVMSHLGNADEPDDPLNARQLAEFLALTEGMDVRRSLGATAGTLLGPDYHFDMTRVGIGLYGGLPFVEARPVVRAEAPIVQLRDLSVGETIGYGATWRAERPSRIATIPLGYADGLLRALSNSGRGFIDGQPVPFAGRVSMDLITLDVTGVPCRAGDIVEILGPNQTIDQLARAAGTIGHEVLTSLGVRYRRVHVGG